MPSFNEPKREIPETTLVDRRLLLGVLIVGILLIVGHLAYQIVQAF